MAHCSLLVLLSLLAISRAGFLNGDCELKHPNGKDVEYMEWLYDLFIHPPVSDISEPGTEVARFTARNIKQITGRQSKYVRVALEDNTLILTLKDEFVYFEENETQPDILINIDFECSEGSARIGMWATVADSNNHAPRFLNGAPYEYVLPLPFPSGLPLACVAGVAAAAEDVDLSTTRVTFTLMGTDALRVDGAWRVARSFHLNVSTTRYITQPLTATLIATDNGDPPRSTETSLFIKADSKHSVPALAQAIEASTPVKNKSHFKNNTFSL